MTEAEEIPDLLFYRPLAFVFVKMIYRTPITPNQVTVLSGLFGVAAAWMFSIGNTQALLWGASLYAAANILDCADGQLARLQRSGTLLGRIIDGAADYISSIAIFVGIGVGLATQNESAGLFVIAAGVSSALHALFFDHYQNEFISTVRSEKNFLEQEIEKFTHEAARLRMNGHNTLRVIIISLYSRYLQIQHLSSTKKKRVEYGPLAYKSANAMMIRIWSMLGPTTNRTLLIVCAIAGNITAYLWIIVLGGNVWMLTALFLQQRIHRRLGDTSAPEIFVAK